MVFQTIDEDGVGRHRVPNSLKHDRPLEIRLERHDVPSKL
jgi:hypothetical protein